MKLLASVEAIHFNNPNNLHALDVIQFLIIFTDNKCCIKSCICEHSPLLLAQLLDYLQQQCDLKILKVGLLDSENAEKFLEVVKHHRKLEVVSISEQIHDNYFIQCLSELMYRPCFQELTIKVYPCTDTPGTSSTSFNGVHSLLSAFFLSPYPVTLRLDMVCLRLNSTEPIQVPLAINTEQQSKNIDLHMHPGTVSVFLNLIFFPSTLY